MIRVGSFSDRLSFGNQAANELRSILESLGWIVSTCGQEIWMTPKLRERLRHNHSDLTVRAARYAPDYLIYKDGFPLTYLEAKASTSTRYKNYAIEKACYENLMSLFGNGERCVVAFREASGIWNANNVEELVIVKDMSDLRQEAHGSRTPFLLIAKTSTFPLKSFLEN